jgi:hypothetical protein
MRKAHCCRPDSGALAPREGSGARAGVLSCAVRLSRLQVQPLAPPGSSKSCAVTIG